MRGVQVSEDEQISLTSLKIISSLPGGKRLNRPLDVRIAYDDDEVIVSEPLFHIHAIGTTITGTLAEFRRVLSEELDELTVDEEELGLRLWAELQYLKELITEDGNLYAFHLPGTTPS